MNKSGKNNRKKRLINFTASILVVVVLAAVIYVAMRGIFPLKYEECISENSAKYDLDPYLVMGIIRAESGFRENVTSDADAKGLMQITGKTGRQIAENLGINEYSDELLYDPEINIRFGTWYINWLLIQFDNNEINALAAYNAGIGHVKKWLADSDFSADGENLDNIPFPETKNFVSRVRLYRDIYNAIY